MNQGVFYNRDETEDEMSASDMSDNSVKSTGLLVSNPWNSKENIPQIVQKSSHYESFSSQSHNQSNGPSNKSAYSPDIPDQSAFTKDDEQVISKGFDNLAITETKMFEGLLLEFTNNHVNVLHFLFIM
jgi:hypothetical protein